MLARTMVCALVALGFAVHAHAGGLAEGGRTDAARLLGVADRVGSIEQGKDADLALYDGDPFEYTTHCTNVVINGEVFPGEARE